MIQKVDNNWKKGGDNSELLNMLFEYIRYWKWFVLSALVCFGIGLFFVLTVQKEYKPSISILLNEAKGAGGKAAAGLGLDELGVLTTTSNIENEIGIFLSPDLMSQVIDSLNLQTTYYVKNKLRKTEIYDKAPFFVHYKVKGANFSGKIEFYIQKSNSGFDILGTYLMSDGTRGDLKESFNNFPAQIILPNDSSSLNIRLTAQNIDESEKYYVKIEGVIPTVASLCNNLSVTQASKGSSILNLALSVNNTEKGTTILKEMVKQYNELNVRVNNEMAFNTALFINDRLKEISAELGDAETDVVDYKQRNRITDLSSEALLFIQQTGQNEQRLMEIETQLNIISMVERFINDPANRYKVIPNLGVSDAALSQIITDYNSKLLINDQLLKNTGEENPARMRLVEEIDNIHKSISSSIKNVKDAYRISKQDFIKQSHSTQSRVRSVPQQEKGLIEKVRQQQIKETLFLYLMQKREETNLSIASTADKARIISSLQFNTLPIAPKSNVILLASLILGLLIPVLVIYLINLLKTRLRNRDEVERFSNVNIIGEICKSDIKDQIVVSKNQNSIIAEMFRSLRNNINFTLRHKSNQIIIVTSTLSAEGKTFVSVNLSMSFAISGKKVLLIGADIRNPKLKNYVNLPKKEGLTDFLVEGQKDWRKYISVSDLEPNLHIMGAGTIHPNPNELLMGPELERFLLEARNEYDVIILDTAPVGLVSDTYLMNDAADLCLYIVRENVTPKTAINFINMQQSEKKLNNMYLVFNGSSLDNSYKYGYGKAYGYAPSK